MRVTFYTVNSNSPKFKSRLYNNSSADFAKNQNRLMFGNLRFSLGVGITMGGIAASIIRYKKIPNVFANSLEICSVCSYLTYMGTLIATPFRVK